jgi:hypothetical protein
VAENLDAIIIRMIKIELSYFSPKGISPTEDYFAAASRTDVSSDVILEDLFGQSIKQLIDYSVQRIEQNTPTVVLPLKFGKADMKAIAERLEKRLSLGLAKARVFQLLENKDLPDILKTLTAQFSQKYDSNKVAELGKLVPARLAVFGQIDLVDPKTVEMLVKLVRLETGEILSLSLLKIENGLVSAQEKKIKNSI